MIGFVNDVITYIIWVQVIAKPDVHKSPNSDTYIVFGEAKIEASASKPPPHGKSANQESATWTLFILILTSYYHGGSLVGE